MVKPIKHLRSNILKVKSCLGEGCLLSPPTHIGHSALCKADVLRLCHRVGRAPHGSKYLQREMGRMPVVMIDRIDANFGGLVEQVEMLFGDR